MFADQQRISTSGYSSANYSADKYGTEAANDLRRHLIGEESNARTELNRTSSPNNRPAKNHPSPPLHDTMVSGGGFERKVSGGVGERMVYDLVSRKDTARRNLMGHLYTRQPVLKRSYSFVAGERPATETLLPSLQRREKHSAISFNSERYTKPGRNVNVRDLKQWQSDKNAGKRNGCVQPGKNGTPNQKALNGGRPGSHQISLPELINDINMSSRLHSPGDSDGEDSASAHGHKGPLDLIRSMDMKPASPVKSKAVRYRPITPGVIEKLNKLRLSSKVRTEQWVKTLPLDYRAAYSETDDNLTEPSEHSPKEKEWIYTAT
ncbi:uncharacterized protein LOC110455360 [Mizuhopecten yessoensis]|uniref:uncharacterized protein LOC110455360 n=1 Tax=Mizuhopecten yessoensis TaxID=6573 RepID=UPI000B45BD02|nr:uncharacterized protein LOC110455360 [Mizuhopecten yessoensis]XP_021361124.1 uncharacterized protein LOC110455360 [Mizuhopecten yessoensis]XP_021361126.1 uncharacterized protein LOC110455360 [Mizuhopecten yessoensis]